MKVLMINSVCGIYSTGRICTSIAEGLDQVGIETKIAYARDFCPERFDKYGVKFGSKLGIYAHILFSRIFDNVGFCSRHSTKKLVKWIKEYDPDVILLHNLHGYYINVKILFDYLKTCGKKIYWVMHDCWAMTGHCAHFDSVNCEKWKTGCENCPQKAVYPICYIFDRSKKNYKRKKEIFTGVPNLTMITPSKWIESVVKQSYLSEYPTKVINNGVDLQAFYPKESNLREIYQLQDKKVVLGVSSCWKLKKGLEDFIELSTMLKDDYKIVIVGVTPSQKEKLPKNVLAIERTTNLEELVKIYSMADVFVNPTKEEVFGLVNIEALACGTPVITYKVGGSVETIDEKSGLGVERNDVKGLYNAILNVCENKLFKREDCVNRAKNFENSAKIKEYVHLIKDSTKKK